MKALSKLLTDFVAWRWSPAVGLLSASLLYVLVVVGLVPTEIGVPVANAKFVPKPATPANAALPTAFATSGEESAVPSEPVYAPEPVAQTRSSDFGRRGFSPPLERPEQPPAPPPDIPPQPVIPPPPPVAAAPEPQPGAPARPRFGGIFQSINNAVRQGLGHPDPGQVTAVPPGQPPGEVPPPSATEPPAAPADPPAGVPGQPIPGQPPPGQPVPDQPAPSQPAPEQPEQTPPAEQPAPPGQPQPPGPQAAPQD